MTELSQQSGHTWMPQKSEQREGINKPSFGSSKEA